MTKNSAIIGNLFLLCIVGVTCFACQASRRNAYPEFVELKQRTNTITMMIDAMVIDAMQSDTSKMNVIENREVSELLLDLCADSLKKKGLTVEHRMISSIGLLMNAGIPYRIVQTVADQATRDEELSIGRAPFYLHESLAQDPDLRQRLAAVYATLINSPQKNKEVKTTIPEAVRVSTKYGSGMLMVILLGGTNVSAANALGDYPTNSSPGQGVIKSQKISRLSVLAFIINGKTGEVVWDVRSYKNGGIIHRDKIINVVADMLRDLP